MNHHNLLLNSASTWLQLSALLLWLSACALPVQNLPPGSRMTERGLIITMEAIYFNFDTAALDTTALKVINSLVALLQQQGSEKYVIAIDGYTDVIGKEDYNLGLSQRRADKVKAAFTERGIAPERLDAKGFGQADPVANNQTEQGRQQNRRVEILLLQPLDIQSRR